jgi:predicted MFS family arabinose efflux permease
MFFGGRIAEHFGFVTIFWVDIAIAAAAIAWFALYVTPHFHRHKLR